MSRISVSIKNCEFRLNIQNNLGKMEGKKMKKKYKRNKRTKMRTGDQEKELATDQLLIMSHPNPTGMVNSATFL